ncbi:MAG: response regulator [Deltaproteobacteria bacterium]|nr:response regulator [Deltaproteobacteria bacterium]
MGCDNRTRTVMVVGDDLETCALLERLLREESYHVVAVSSGVEALALLGDEKPDFILLDVVRANMDGVATLRALRYRGFEGPVVILAANGTIKTAREAMLLGAFEFITKPFDRDLLKSVLREGLPDGTATWRGANACAV